MKFVAAVLLLTCAHSFAGEAVIAVDTPIDNPLRAPVAETDKAIAPYLAQAQASYPSARDRFLVGLNSGERFFLVTRIYDPRGQMEQIFVLVNRYEGTQVVGRIASQINGRSGFRTGDPYEFPESAVVDWVITRPDGGEEGNFVGKFLDTYKSR